MNTSFSQTLSFKGYFDMQLSLKPFFFSTIALATLTIECRQDLVSFQTHKKLRQSVHEGDHSQALRYSEQYQEQLEAHKIPSGQIVLRLRLPTTDGKKFSHNVEQSHKPGCNCGVVGLISFLIHKGTHQRDSSISRLITHFRELPTMGQALLFARILEDAFRKRST